MSSPEIVFNVYRNGPSGWMVRVGPAIMPGAPYREYTFANGHALSEWLRVYALCASHTKAKARAEAFRATCP